MFTVVDLFAGVGGLSYGFSTLSDFRIVAANEINKAIATAYEANHPHTPVIVGDIGDLTASSFRSVGVTDGVDLVVGGPPCQSYSTLGKREMDDRANLFLQYKRVLNLLQPRAFLFESVVGILSMNKGRLFQQIKNEFEELGYSLKYKVVDAVDYGVPQYRKRVILVGFKGDNPFEFPEPTYGDGLLPYVTMKDAVGDLPPLEVGEQKTHYAKAPYNDFLCFVRTIGVASVTEHIAPKNSEHLVKIMQALGDGQTKDDLPPSIRPKSGYKNTYAKLWWEKPSTTITRNFSCPSSSRCIHPIDSRALTVREGARLQSFPDDYVFFGSDETKRLEIGNAVPPLLSVALAKQMAAALKMF